MTVIYFHFHFHFQFLLFLLFLSLYIIIPSIYYIFPKQEKRKRGMADFTMKTTTTGVSQFYQFITKLNYFKDINSNESNSMTIQQDENRHYNKENSLLQNVPIRFSSQKNYVQLWKKLFFQQLKAQIQNCKKQQKSQPEQLQIVGFESQNEFKLFNFKKKQSINSSFGSGTLVVLSPLKKLRGNENYTHLIGITQFKQDVQLQVKVTFNEKQQQKQSFQLITTSKKWFIQKIANITALQRTFKALLSFQKIQDQLKEVILRPDLHNKQVQQKFSIPIGLDNKLKAVYNQSQYKAIIESLKKLGITLIQGPPGTGKTKTVLGTLSVLLNSQNQLQDDNDQPLVLNWKKSSKILQNPYTLNPWIIKGYVDWRDQPIINNVNQNLNLTKTYLKSQQTDHKIVLVNHKTDIQTPRKILICGPSNASVDQIIRKLILQQIFNKDGQRYLPKFVRIGQNYDSNLTQYSLQKIAQKALGKNKNSDIYFQKMKVLKEYPLIFGTLSSFGHQIIQNSKIQFDTVVIDEAGQSVQIDNLIPLIYKCKRLILIGDPNQLPATVFSKKCLEHQYDQSLFERLMKCNYPVSILKIQYRMNPQISHVIGHHFYGDQITNGQKQYNFKDKQIPSSFLMFHLQNSAENAFNKSFRNFQESKFIKKLITFLSKNHKDIAVVSPYSQQINLIQNVLKSKQYEIKTIDSFQGRQKNIIILSTVRSRFVGRKLNQNRKKTIGFVGDMRRINVSLSRAKDICIIVGDLKRLSALSKKWKQIVKEAMENDQVFSVVDIKQNIGTILKNQNKKYHLKHL